MLKVLNVEKIKSKGGKLIPDGGELVIHFPNLNSFSGYFKLVHKNKEQLIRTLESADFISDEISYSFSKLHKENFEAFDVKMVGCCQDTKDLIKSWEK